MSFQRKFKSLDQNWTTCNESLNGWILTSINLAKVTSDGRQVAGKLLETNNECEHFERCGDYLRISGLFRI